MRNMSPQDPRYLPPAQIIQLLNELYDESQRIVHNGDTDDLFYQCFVCGDVEGHAADCPIPAIEKWLTLPRE